MEVISEMNGVACEGTAPALDAKAPASDARSIGGGSRWRALALWAPLLMLAAACSSASDDARTAADATDAADATGAADAGAAADGAGLGAAAASGATATAAASGPSLETATELGVSNVRMPLPGVLTAGQLSPEQLEALSEAGYGTFISLRPVAESGAGWEEAHAAQHPYDFDRVPVSGAAGLTRENVEAFAKLLEAAGDEPTVVYCGSGNRAGAMLALKAHWIDGVAAEEAYRLGVDAGLAGLAPTVSELLGLETGG